MRRYNVCISCVILLFAIGSVRAVEAQPAPQASSSSAIPPMSVKHALIEFATREHLQLIYVSQVADGVLSKGAPAGLSQRATLQAILAGTGLKFDFLNEDTLRIFSEESAEASRKAPAAVSATAGAPVPAASEPEQKPATLGTVFVTGTHIRGAPPASPVIEITNEQMIQAGQTELGEVIRSIPQNFSGGQNPGVTLGSGGINNQNVTGGSALNLRGLGQDATLTLLNGRRMAYSGFGRGIDISQIPMAAVERLEIVADGASAIYGSDAVGGVANIILKTDYNGFSETTRVGGATSGGNQQWQQSLTFGKSWSTGGFIAVANYSRSDEIDASQREYTSYLDSPTYLLPSSSTRSLLLTGHQEISDVATFKLIGFYTQHDSTSKVVQFGDLATQWMGNEQYQIAPTLSFDLPGTWSLTIDGTFGRDRGTGSQLITGPYGYESSYCYCNRTTAVEIHSEGSLFKLPGGDAQVAFGFGYNKVSSGGASEGNKHAYGELYLPFVSPSAGVPLVNQLSLTAAVRYETYSSYGDVTTPKLGLVYAPTQDFDFRASWGKSFKTPTFTQKNQRYSLYLWAPTSIGGPSYPPPATALMTWGGNEDLQPERAKSWTFTFGLHPRAMPDLSMKLSYFNIDYKDRIGQPLASYTQALSNPAYAPFINYQPTLSQIQALVDLAGQDFLNFARVPYDPANVIAIAENRYINFISQDIQGFDLDVRYAFDIGSNSFTLSENANWIQSKQKSSPQAQPITLAGTAFNPPSFRSRLGLTWERGRFLTSAFHNFIGGVSDTRSIPSVKGKSMQTFDVVGIYRPTDDVDVSVSIQNLTNETPPFLRNSLSFGVNYDSTNYSAIGRFVGVSITKRWD